MILAERDILGTQLIRKNDETALFYEKIKIQQRTMAQGELAYQERLGDIQLLRYKINELMRSLKIYRSHVTRRFFPLTCSGQQDPGHQDRDQ